MTPAAQRILAVVLVLVAIVGLVVGFVYLGDHPKRSALAFIVAVVFAGGAAFLFFRGGRGGDTTTT
jgi:hypothetical protein